MRQGIYSLTGFWQCGHTMANATLRYRQAQYKSCPRERDAHTTVHHFYLDELLVLAVLTLSVSLDTEIL
ncbi:hypothetical protein BMF77_04576 [Dolichospermum sp. UHCC 0315A]|nr:hypothetical protein BMF77_04576 [Dolichospermum sp. UHCC 0315A]